MRSVTGDESNFVRFDLSSFAAILTELEIQCEELRAQRKWLTFSVLCCQDNFMKKFVVEARYGKVRSELRK